MQQLRPEAEREVQDLAQRYGVSNDAVRSLLSAVSAGGGTMAQFYIQELGGGGQWMRGGMTMVGDMFNSRLQSVVSGLCSELSALLGSHDVFVSPPAPPTGGSWTAPANTWWPAEFGSPSSTGGQNDTRYAYFPNSRRLAIDRNGTVTIYDTLDHHIGGVQQQQAGSAGSPSFTSQYGTFTVESLPIVIGAAASSVGRPPAQRAPSQPDTPEVAATKASASSQTTGSPQSQEEILATLERLGQLHQKGVLSDDEFKSKKAELLARL
jgi:Short C-terminal domain